MSSMEFESFLKKLFTESGLPLNDLAVSRFVAYKDLLVEWNKKINLTRILEDKDIAIKHFLDSVITLKSWEFPAGAKVVDIGSGAGFPGVPLKIIRPDLDFTLVESSGKKADFLRELTGEIGLGAKVINARAEEIGGRKEYRERFDIGVARAVAHLSVLCEYILPMLVVEGTFLAYKGESGAKEVSESHGALETLRGRVKLVAQTELPFEAGKRVIIVVRKNDSTPLRFPRRIGIPQKRPL